MSVRDEIRQFLANPSAFAVAELTDQSRTAWRTAHGLVTAHLAALGHRPLREAQESAFRDIADLRCALVLGPPGTGKTHLLGWMAAGLLVAARDAGIQCRVLVSGFTKVSISNLMEKIVECSTSLLAGSSEPMPIAFLGNSPPDDLPPAIAVHATSPNDIEGARAFMLNDRLVAGATTWGLNSLLKFGNFPGGDGYTAPLFDLVLIDEASQMIVSQGLMTLAGLALGGRLIVAGDDRQLPPVRATFDAQMPDGRVLGNSLYTFLKSAAVREFALEETYRLNAPLAAHPATHSYDGRYRSAVPDRRLPLVDGWRHALEPWEAAALNPDYPVCVLLHDGPDAGSDNPFERALLRQVVERLIPRLRPADGASAIDGATLWQHRLAVISPHRIQNAALREELGNLPVCGGVDAPPVVETVDRIQGRERDVIVAGYAVADEEYAVAEGAFLFSPNRLNVMVTRARHKLILAVSRRLLEVIPPEEEVFDAADRLREYLFECQFVDRVQITGSDGRAYPVEIRVRQFDEAQPLPDLRAPTPPAPPPEMTQELQAVLDAIVAIAGRDQYNDAADFEVDQVCQRTVSFGEYRALAHLGHIRAYQRGKRSGGLFFVFHPSPPPATLPFPNDLITARTVVPDLAPTLRRGTNPARYDEVRALFLWFDSLGNDQFEAIAERLVAEGICRKEQRNGLHYFDVPAAFAPGGLAAPPPEPVPEEGSPQDGDWHVLNRLEDLEQDRINFGQYETFTSTTALATELHADVAATRAALRRLQQHQYLMWLGDDVVRSRMSELAREVRYAKQRFGPNDAGGRPFVVRSLRVEAVNRYKPQRNVSLAPTLASLEQLLANLPHAATVLRWLPPTLLRCWGVANPTLAAFQIRGLIEILPAYLGVAPAHDAFVITADTGSGKTEAACLPLILGAAIDALTDRRGVKAILVYPRIRLAYNQAQRLVRYLAALAREPGAPTLSLGLQTTAVPRTFAHAEPTLWRPLPGPGSGHEFPFFACPAAACAQPLHILPGAGVPTPGGNGRRDQLRCPACGWTYDGFVGTKTALRDDPPDFFVPVTESLHQWLQSEEYGRLFGDDPHCLPPRAVLADEIHLYSHIHGAQVGYTLRRLLARATVNASAAAPLPLAIGMSATLGRPDHVWGQLVGRQNVREIRVEEDERQDNPKGREYFYFVQTEVESRGRNVAGASTTIQALMCLAHGMRRRRGQQGGFRGIAFFDSIDNLKRLHADYRDAERNKRLARLRTALYSNDPVSRRPRLRCCGDPAHCDTFRDGECWYFAAKAGAAPADPTNRPNSGSGHADVVANDLYQVTAAGRYLPGQSLDVMPFPVYSGTSGRVDEIIGRSDLVFATSSLEVGYDDPNMMLVYQHYAPVNLASFIQRKGRGGRGADDRPVTGVTLSVYSPRDNWYFRHTHQMLSPASFDVPLNMENFFVRRGQALATLLDGIARRQFRLGKRFPKPAMASGAAMAALVGDAANDADVQQLLDLVICGPNGVPGRALDAMEIANLPQFWHHAWAPVEQGDVVSTPTWRDLLPWVPGRLFDAINLPLLTVTFPRENGGDDDSAREDIAQAFSRLAPGNATRQFTSSTVLWLIPGNGPFGPLYRDEVYENCIQEDLLTTAQRTAAGNTDAGLSEAVRRQLPSVCVDQFAPGQRVSHMLCRPLSLRLVKLGQFNASGQWRSEFCWNRVTRRLVRRGPNAGNDDDLVGISDKTSSSLLGFPLVAASQGLATPRPLRGMQRLATDLWAYTGERVGGAASAADTGLRVSMAYWGVDVALLLDQTPRTVIPRTRLFGHPRHKHVQLHGYSLDTEGVQLTPRSDQLEAFLDAELARLRADEPRRRYLASQFFRYLLVTRFAARGLSGYSAGPLAELIVAAAGDVELRATLNAQVNNFQPQSFLRLITVAYDRHLACHPLLSAARVAALADEITVEAFPDIYRSAMRDAADLARFRAYLRSLVLHGLALSLNDLFVIHGRGNERQVHIHARLPVQFDQGGGDTITIFEGGDHGDGTTRAFLLHLDEAIATWRRGELADCAHAARDAILELLFADPTQHNAWRALDPDAPGTMPRVARELTGTSALAPEHVQALHEALFQTEVVGTTRFAHYDLLREIRVIRDRLRQRLSREPGPWGLVSAVVRAAEENDPTCPTLCLLLATYAGLDAVCFTENLSPADRLADQVHRLGAALCVDGCTACLHRGSMLMPESHAVHALSRSVLANFRDHVLQDYTRSVVSLAQLPRREWIYEAVRQHGACRLLIAPAVYEQIRGTPLGAGLPPGVVDPLTRVVVVTIE